MNCQLDHTLVSTCDICSYDVDLFKKLSIQNVCRFFQESAWKHAEMLGVGYTDFFPIGKLWVLSRLAVSIYEYPQWGETITLHTWPSGCEGLFALRDYEIKNSADKTIICGRSAWLIIDRNRRRPQRIEQVACNLPIVNRINEFIVETAKIDELTGDFDASIVLSRYSDLDMNGHVNNTAYIEWIMDTYTMEFHKQYELRNISVNFMAETMAGEQVKINSGKLTDTLICQHSLVKSSDNTEVCRVITQWGKRTIS